MEGAIGSVVVSSGQDMATWGVGVLSSVLGVAGWFVVGCGSTTSCGVGGA